jgi:hypothetical protein
MFGKHCFNSFSFLLIKHVLKQNIECLIILEYKFIKIFDSPC